MRVTVRQGEDTYIYNKNVSGIPFIIISGSFWEEAAPSSVAAALGDVALPEPEHYSLRSH